MAMHANKPAFPTGPAAGMQANPMTSLHRAVTSTPLPGMGAPNTPQGQGGNPYAAAAQGAGVGAPATAQGIMQAAQKTAEAWGEGKILSRRGMSGLIGDGRGMVDPCAEPWATAMIGGSVVKSACVDERRPSVLGVVAPHASYRPYEKSARWLQKQASMPMGPATAMPPAPPPPPMPTPVGQAGMVPPPPGGAPPAPGGMPPGGDPAAAGGAAPPQDPMAPQDPAAAGGGQPPTLDGTVPPMGMPPTPPLPANPRVNPPRQATPADFQRRQDLNTLLHMDQQVQPENTAADMQPDLLAMGSKSADTISAYWDAANLFDKLTAHFAAACKVAAVEKQAAQDNGDEQHVIKRSATGESKGLTYQHKPDHYAQGQDAWASVSGYLKGGKDKKPNPFMGKHAADGTTLSRILDSLGMARLPDGTLQDVTRVRRSYTKSAAADIDRALADMGPARDDLTRTGIKTLGGMTLAGLSGAGAVGGGVLGATSGALNPGLDVEGKPRSRWREALKRGLGYGAAGAVAAPLAGLGGAAAAFGAANHFMPEMQSKIDALNGRTNKLMDQIKAGSCGDELAFKHYKDLGHSDEEADRLAGLPLNEQEKMANWKKTLLQRMPGMLRPTAKAVLRTPRAAMQTAGFMTGAAEPLGIAGMAAGGPEGMLPAIGGAGGAFFSHLLKLRGQHGRRALSPYVAGAGIGAYAGHKANDAVSRWIEDKVNGSPQPTAPTAFQKGSSDAQEKIGGVFDGPDRMQDRLKRLRNRKQPPQDQKADIGSFSTTFKYAGDGARREGESREAWLTRLALPQEQFKEAAAPFAGKSTMPVVKPGFSLKQTPPPAPYSPGAGKLKMKGNVLKPLALPTRPAGIGAGDVPKLAEDMEKAAGIGSAFGKGTFGKGFSSAWNTFLGGAKAVNRNTIKPAVATLAKPRVQGAIKRNLGQSASGYVVGGLTGTPQEGEGYNVPGIGQVGFDHGRAMLGAAAFNPALNRIAGKGNAMQRAAAVPLQTMRYNMAGGFAGSALDTTAGQMGLDTGGAGERWGGRLGTAAGLSRGIGKAVGQTPMPNGVGSVGQYAARAAQPAMTKLRQAGSVTGKAMGDFSQHALAPAWNASTALWRLPMQGLRAHAKPGGWVDKGLGSLGVAQLPTTARGWGANLVGKNATNIPGYAGRVLGFGSLAGLGAGGVMKGIDAVDDRIKGSVQDTAINTYKEMAPMMAGHATNVMDQYLDSAGLMGPDGRVQAPKVQLDIDDAKSQIGRHLSGIGDQVFHQLGMDPSRMSTPQKIAILGGMGLLGTGAVTGNKTMMGIGGAAGAGGMLYGGDDSPLMQLLNGHNQPRNEYMTQMQQTGQMPPNSNPYGPSLQ